MPALFVRTPYGMRPTAQAGKTLVPERFARMGQLALSPAWLARHWLSRLANLFQGVAGVEQVEWAGLAGALWGRRAGFLWWPTICLGRLQFSG